jgi:hypothetical protein
MVLCSSLHFYSMVASPLERERERERENSAKVSEIERLIDAVTLITSDSYVSLVFSFI